MRGRRRREREKERGMRHLVPLHDDVGLVNVDGGEGYAVVGGLGRLGLGTSSGGGGGVVVVQELGLLRDRGEVEVGGGEWWRGGGLEHPVLVLQPLRLRVHRLCCRNELQSDTFSRA